MESMVRKVLSPSIQLLEEAQKPVSKVSKWGSIKGSKEAKVIK
jgi:hypothetical protein